MKSKRYFLLFLILLLIPILTNAKSRYLYDVIKDEVSTGYAKEYTGSHHDSFLEEPSMPIYYWKTYSSNEMMYLKNKNNIIFGNQCWVMIRTTDTGGVKLLYNGPAEDNQCILPSNAHTGATYPGYKEGDVSASYSTAYYFSDHYAYDSSTKKFSLVSPTSYQVSTSNHSELIGKYTCRSNNPTATCTTLEVIESFTGDRTAKVFRLSSSSIKNYYGFLPFNSLNNSIAAVGYKYGDPYALNVLPGTTTESLAETYTHTVLNKANLNENYWYSDNLSCNESTEKCTLVNPFKVESNNDYPNLKGKYTMLSTNENGESNSVYFIAHVNGKTAYYRPIDVTNYEEDLSIKMSSSFHMENGQYILDEPEDFPLESWYTSYSSNVGKFTCNTNSNQCTTLDYIVKTANNNYNYIDVSKTIIISKERNGLNLIDTIEIPKYKLIKDFEDYQDYKYTCKSTNTICSDNTLSIILEKDSYGAIKIVPNYYYGSSVTWNGREYTLVDPIPLENYNNLDTLKNHHYYCGNGLKKCNTVNYIHSIDLSRLYYGTISLTNGETSSVQALEKMLKDNTHNSTIKSGLDIWYKTFMLDYDEYIEDTVFCNDRRLKSIEGWDPSSPQTDKLIFTADLGDGKLPSVLYTYDKPYDLQCPEETDRFSIYNSKAKLNYKVGLLTTQEWNQISMAENANEYKSIFHLTPKIINTMDQLRYVQMNTTIMGGVGSNIYGSYSSTAMSVQRVQDAGGVRPVISLVPNMRYYAGDGSRENPYIVDYNDYYSIDVVIKNETKDLDIEIEDITSVLEGEIVVFKVTPIKGYKVTGIDIIDEDNQTISYEETDQKNEYTFIMPAKNVTIIPSYEKTSAAVNVEENNHTKEIKIEVNDVQAVVYEDEVKFTITPEEGYELENVVITDEEGNEVEFHNTDKENEYTFVMPDIDVTIKPIYRKIESVNPYEPPIPTVNPYTGRNYLWIGVLIIITFLSRRYLLKKKLNEN